MNKNRQILLVEDDSDVLFVASRKLTAAGFEVLPASDGLDALKRMLDHPACRQMVTDFNMPLLGGNHWIRFLERFCADWTIAVVSSDDIDPGRFIYVPKPVDYVNLVQIFAQESP